MSRRFVHLALLLVPCAAQAQLVISDTLNGASSSYDWKTYNGACLTAGNGSGTIPACVGLAYYSGKTLVGGANGTLPDSVGSGALRLSNGDTASGGTNGDYQSGAVVSNFTFPSNQGLNVVFKTVTYGGDGYQTSGADGISFFLSDGAQAPSIGATGGALGYSCRNVDNVVADGVIGGYLGVGIDEFGNFANANNVTSDGAGFSPGSIVLRGAGSVAWSWLNANYPSYYPSSLSSADRITAVQNTCKSGKLVNGQALLDYPYMAISKLPSGVQIYSQEAVATPKRNVATPITYALNLTQDGLLSVSYSVNGGSAQPLLPNTSITAKNGPLPASFRFGFTASTGGGSNVHEIMCFKAAPSRQSGGSAGTNVQQSSQVRTGTQVYSAFYDPTYWSGNLTAQDLVYDATAGTLSVRSVSNWDGSCVLTGGACAATTGTNTAQVPTSRQLLTWNGSTGIPFRWKKLTSDQQAALTAGDPSPATGERLSYLRGNRSLELSAGNGGTFRTRFSVLGDIIDASPVPVGPPSQAYAGAWTDLLYPKAAAPEASTYTTFRTSNATRLNVVYAGSNDGFLHGFRAGAFDAAGNYVNTSSYPNDGNEVLGYLPGAVLSTIHSTTAAYDFSSPQYAHAYYVDATPGTGDLYYAGAWHTWLVGGLGAGGNANGPVVATDGTASGVLYALDVTDPSRFSEDNAASLVKGEWTSSTLSCIDNAACGDSFGSSYGTPVITRMHNGQWAVIFGNGLNSKSGTAGVYVMLVDPGTGATSFRFLDTVSGTVGTNKNGIVAVTPFDLDGDNVADYLYAGDVLGNVWRFDVTSNDASKWAAGAAPLFSTGGKPISSSVAMMVSATPGSLPRVMVGFGTGRRWVQTQTTGVSYASGAQALYGVWDWNMAAWNTVNPSASYASLASPQTVSSTKLVTQTVTTVAATATAPAYRTLGSTAVCWQGSSTCASGNTQFGWKVHLRGSQEQVIYSPVVKLGMFIVNTTIPSTSQALSCDTQPTTGFTMALSPANGGASSQSFFLDPNVPVGTGDAKIIVNGLGTNAAGTPSLVTTASGDNYLVQHGYDGKPFLNKVAKPVAKGRRLTWIQLR